MNKIYGLLDKSDYEGYYDFINFRIDNYWLDEKLEELYPNNMYRGLIPTLVGGMERKDEEDVVWKRILPKENETTICPILMCPDDNDFSCTIIVAEITNYRSFIKWNKIGLDMTKEWEAEKIGSKVEWFNKISELNFETSDYIKMLDNFKKQIELDKQR
jgi:hypothetical protein